jgi:hypothetical protein
VKTSPDRSRSIGNGPVRSPGEEALDADRDRPGWQLVTFVVTTLIHEPASIVTLPAILVLSGR